jgi:hypothetical protein
MSYVTSAGSNGKTCRQDVLGRVGVPVMQGAAVRARPVPGGRAQGCEQVPAGRACLAGRVPPVDHDQVPSGRGCLVGDLAAELAPPAVRDRRGERPVADHVLHGQVLDHDDVMVADQAGGGAVQEIGPAGTDLPVGAGDLRPGLGAVRGAFAAAGEPALVPGQVPRPACQPPRVRDLLPVAGDGEFRDAQVDAGSMSGQDQVKASGVLILARNRRPWRYRNPERVYSADCRPLRDLYRGYRVRPAKKLPDATCWWRIACWSGTEDTSLSQPRSSLAFIPVR